MSKAVCIDFDGVLASYDRWRGIDHIGEPIEGAKEFVNSLKRKGYKVIIYTGRLWNFDEPGKKREKGLVQKARVNVIKWLLGNGFEFDELHGKPIAAAYVDDRAVAVSTNPLPGNLAYAAAQVFELIKEES